MTYQIITFAIMIVLLAVALYLLNISHEELRAKVRLSLSPPHKALEEAKEIISNLRSEKYTLEREIKKLKLALEIKVMDDELEKED